MATRRIEPPWDYLHDASVPSLESYELSRLNHAANLRREIAALLDQWIEDSTQALLARWVREGRTLPQAELPIIKPPQSELPFDTPRSQSEPPRGPTCLLKLPRRSARTLAAGNPDPLAAYKRIRGRS
jgi:hypothetical protein